MKKFIVIGLGNFGYSIATKLIENNCEVLGMDSDKEIVQKSKDVISYAIIGDATKKEVLESLAIKDFNGAIISIGQDMASSILVSLYLKEIGIPMIVVRAISDDHGKILKMIGVSEVVFPEKDMAIRVANRLSLKNAVDYLTISEEYGILEVTPPKAFIGKSLKELQISSRFGCQVIGIKCTENSSDIIDIPDDNINIKIAPAADDIIKEKSTMIVIGRHRDIEKIQSLK